MSSQAISGISNTVLNGLASAQGISVDQLVARTQNARLSGGLSIAQRVNQGRQTIQSATVESLLSPDKQEKLKGLQERITQSGTTASTLKDFRSRLGDIEKRTQDLLNAGPSGAFEGKAFSVSNKNAVDIQVTGGQTATTFTVDVLRLASKTDGAQISINGGATITSAVGSNTFDTSLTGFSGITITAKEVTVPQGNQPPPPPEINVKSFNVTNEQLRLELEDDSDDDDGQKDAAANFSVGDVVRFKGVDGKIGGLSSGTNFVIDTIEGKSGKITLRDEAGNKIDLSSLVGKDKDKGKGNDDEDDDEGGGFKDVSGVTIQRVAPEASKKTVTVKVFSDPELVRKALADLTKTVTDAINVVEKNPELAKDLGISRISASLRRSFSPLLGAVGDAITTSGSSNAVSVDDTKLTTALQDSATFVKAERAFRGRGGVGFGLLQVAGGNGDTLQNRVNALQNEQKAAQTQVAELTAEAESKRADLLAGLKDVTTAALSNLSAQASRQALDTRNGRTRGSRALKAAEQNQQMASSATKTLNGVVSNTFNQVSFLQSFSSKLA